MSNQKIKIIPCLDMKEGRVVKGIKFVDLRDARDPVEAAKAYCAGGADELVFLDISATVENRSTRLEWVKKVADVVTIPFCVGGGIRNIDDMKKLFDIGVDKISINTSAVREPDLVEEASKKFGKEKLVIAIDGIKNINKKPRLEVIVSGGNKFTGLDIVDWAKKVEKLGAGEILLTSKDADGTKEGYDLEMTKAVVDAVSIPVTASGGCGKLEHFYDAAKLGCKGLLAASVFHFGEIKIADVKKYLQGKGIEI